MVVRARVISTVSAVAVLTLGGAITWALIATPGTREWTHPAIGAAGVALMVGAVAWSVGMAIRCWRVGYDASVVLTLIGAVCVSAVLVGGLLVTISTSSLYLPGAIPIDD